MNCVRRYGNEYVQLIIFEKKSYRKSMTIIYIWAMYKICRN